MQNSGAGRYLAGLWQHYLPEMLLWRVGLEKHQPRPQVFTAPTWSRASQMSSVGFHRDSTLTFDVEVIRSEVDLASLDPFGQIRCGTFYLGGLLWPASVQIRELKGFTG